MPEKPSMVRGGLLRALALLALLALAACDRPSAADHLSRGGELMGEGDFAGAVIEFKNAVSLAPQNQRARVMLARTYMAMGRSEDALKEFRRARDLGAVDTGVERALVELLLRTGAYQQALEEIETQDASAEPYFHVLRARALLGLGRLEDARQAFEAVPAQAEARPEAELGLVRVARRQGNAAAARDRLAALLERQPDLPEGWVLLGELSLAEGNAAGATQAFERAGELLPEHDLRDDIGRVRAHLAAGRHQAAETALRPLLERNPDNPLLQYLQAFVQRAAGDLEAAHQSLQQVRAALPEHPGSDLLFGEVQFLRGSYEQARSALREFLVQVPGHLPALKLLAASSLRLGEPAEAARLLQPAAANHPDDAQLLLLLGMATLRSGDLDAGSHYLQQAASAAPGAAAVKAPLAISHLLTGDRDEAVAQLRTAVELDPQGRPAEYLLIATLLDAGEHAEALQRARALLDRDSQDAVAHFLLGGALAEAGDRDGARAAYRQAAELDPAYAAPRLRLAHMSMESGQLDQARGRLEEVIEHHPGHADALTRLARLEQARGEAQRALELLRRARAADDQALAPRLVLANYYLNRGRPDQALTVAREAVDIASDNPQAQLALGRALLETGAPDEAIGLLQPLQERFPENAQLALLVGRAQANAGDLGAAQRSLQRALRLSDGELLPARRGLVELALAEGRIDEALRLAGEIQASHSDQALGYVLEGLVHERSGAYGEAVAAYREALSRESTGQTVVRLARALQRGGERQSARRVLERWLEDVPEDLAVRLALAQHHLKAQEFEAAQAQYQRVLEQQPEHAIALNNLAFAQSRLGATGNALETAQKAYQLAPDQPAIADTYGWLLVQNDRLERGLRLLRQASAAAPDNRDIRYHLAAALYRGGNRGEARRELEAILDDETPFAERADAERLYRILAASGG